MVNDMEQEKIESVWKNCEQNNYRNYSMSQLSVFAKLIQMYFIGFTVNATPIEYKKKLDSESYKMSYTTTAEYYTKHLKNGAN